ncbi:MAG: hypothetical protein RL329_3716 [Bacteroidota bacterium]
MKIQNKHAYWLCIILFFKMQNVVAQVIAIEKYPNGAIQKRFHIRAQDTFCVENKFENGGMHSIVWRDSAYFFHSNQVIAQKRYGKKTYFPEWRRIADNDNPDEREPFVSPDFDSLCIYYRDGNLEKHLYHQGDSLWSRTWYLPNGAIYESSIHQKQNNGIFNYFKINEKGIKQIQTDTAARIQKQFGYHQNQLVQQEIYAYQSYWGTHLKEQTLMDSTGKVVSHWVFDSLSWKPTVDKDNGLCLYGLRNPKGEWLVQPKYESIKDFNYAYYIVNENNKYGVLNDAGKTVVPPIWDFLEMLQPIQHYHLPYLQDMPSLSLVYLVEPQLPAVSARLRCRKGDLYGVIDNQGKIILEPIYQGIRKYNNHLYEVKIKERWGIVNEQGKIIVPPHYVEVDFTKHNNLFYTSDTIAGTSNYKDGYAKGLVNDKGKTILPCLFSSVTLDSPRIWVHSFWERERVGLWHFEKGWVVDTTHFYSLEYPYFKPYKVDANGSKKYGLWDASANTLLLPIDYQSIERTEQRAYFYNSTITKPDDAYQNLLLWNVTHHQKCGIYDSKQRKWLLPLKYDAILFFKDSLYLASYHGKWQFINAQAEAVLPETFDAVGTFNIVPPFDKRTYAWVKSFFGVKNNRLSFYTPYSFPSTTPLKTIDKGSWFGNENKKFIFGNDGNRWLVAPDGQVLISPKDSILLQQEDYFVTRHKTTVKQQIIDNQGNKKSFSSKYEIKTMSVKGNWALVQDTMTRRLGMMTLDEKIRVPCRFFAMTAVDKYAIIWARKDSSLYPTSNTLLHVNLCNRDHHWQMYDKRGYLLSSFVFDYAFAWSNHLGIGQVGGKQGLWNQHGVNILPPKYDKIWYDAVHQIFHLVLTENGKTHRIGFANAAGQVIIDAILMNMSVFGGSFAFVETEKGYGIIQKNGDYWIKPQPFALQKSGFSIVDSMTYYVRYVKTQQHYKYLLSTPYQYINIQTNLDTMAKNMLLFENLFLEQSLPNYFIQAENIHYQRNINWYFFNNDGMQDYRYDVPQPDLRHMSSIMRSGVQIRQIFYGHQMIRYLVERTAAYPYYHCENFEFKNNIWQKLPLDAILVWNEANEAALNQLMFQKISALKNQAMDCGNPTQYMQKVKHLFYKLPDGLEFLMPRNNNSNNSGDFVPIKFTWAELQPFL